MIEFSTKNLILRLVKLLIFRRSANGSLWVAWKFIVLHWKRGMGQSSRSSSKSTDNNRVSKYWKVQERLIDHNHCVSQHSALLLNAWKYRRRCTFSWNLHFKSGNFVNDINFSGDSFKNVDSGRWMHALNAIVRSAQLTK